MPKENVVSFRVDDKSFAALSKKLSNDKPVGIKSENQLARKIIDDLIAGRLEYTDPNDRFTDYGLIGD